MLLFLQLISTPEVKFYQEVLDFAEQLHPKLMLAMIEK
jgi:hypothetical protein